VALAEMERKISELTSQRTKLISDHDKSMTAIGKDIGELMRKIQEAEATEKAPKPAPAAPAAAKEAAPVAPASMPEAAPAPVAKPAPVQPAPVAQAAPAAPVSSEESAAAGVGAETVTLHDKDELFEKIRDMMRSRSFISHGLLKEQLKVKGYNVPNLSKLVDQLIREGKLASAGGGNYALGKRA